MRAAIAFAVLLVPGASVASDPEPSPRPRIGLALGGGGSTKGIAHAGVLRWLEEHRVPVDYVAGTSMGGLVGGAYASGMSAAEVHDLLSDAEWDLILSPAAPYRLKSFRRKEDARDYPVRLELGLRHGWRFPSGLNPGHHIGTLLSRIALPYSDVDDFDELPIPFRCVATDMERGESVALGRGFLGSALRATMAMPGVFDPVRLDGRLLSDGGILHNVPADVVRAMGADVVIAVKVSPGPERASESLLGLPERSAGLAMEDITSAMLRKADLVIVPELAKVRPYDLRGSDAMADLGYEAAAAHAAFLLPLALDEEAWKRHLATREARRRRAGLAPAFVEVEGTPDRVAERLRDWLSGGHEGRGLDLNRLETDLDRIVGSGRYASASYSLARREGREGLEVRVSEKTDAPPFLRFSLDVNSEARGLNFNFGTGLTLMDVVGYGSEWRMEASAGAKPGFRTELLEPLGRSGAFVAPRFFLGREKDGLHGDTEGRALSARSRTGAGVAFGWILGANAQIRAGYETAYVRSVTDISAPQLLQGRGGEQLASLRFAWDGFDRPFFPRRGMRVESAVGWYLAAPDAANGFGQAVGAVGAAWPFAKHDRALLSGEGGTSFGGEPPGPYGFALGGPLRLSAYGVDEFRARHYVLGRAGYLRSLTRLPDLAGDRLFLAGFLEVGSTFDRPGEAKPKFSATVGFAAETLFGPVFVGVAVGNDDAYRVYLTLGRLVR